MPTILSHAVAAAALQSAFPLKVPRIRLVTAGALCAMLPDADVLSFGLGIAYGDLFGHRGFTHSLFCAAVLALVVTLLVFRRATPKQQVAIWVYLFFATASHGLLDAMTDGGHGVAFFAPFDNTRYFLPFTPIAVSPISVRRFFSSGGWEVLASEALWIWTPSICFLAAAVAVRHLQRAGASARSE